MSPSRTRRPVHKVRSRREVLTAVGGAAAVVLGTALMIWLLRPGSPGVEGTGGLASRQPRAAWLVALTLAVTLAFGWYVLRNQRRWQGKVIVILAVGGFAILLLAALAGILWPGGLLRHTEPVPEFDPDALPPTTLPPELTSTTAPGTVTTATPTPTTLVPQP
jgi:hypothetical protein